MANSCSTDPNCKFNNNMVLMFQDMNVAKSAPSALLTIYQKFMYPPKVVKKPRFGKLCKFARPFLYLDHGTGNLKFHSKLRSIANLHSESRKIRTILANIYHSLFFLVYPNFLQQNSQNPPNSQILRANHAELTNFALISINLLSFFRHL